jgi:hypothetical protein
MRRRTNSALSVFVVLALHAGCSTQTKTVKTETVYEQPRANAAVVKRVESTETQTKATSEPQGVFSGNVDLVGKTVALPFRFVGGLIDLVF